jgi:hypothetical protein
MEEQKLKAMRPLIIVFLIIVIGSAFVVTWGNALGNSISTTSITNSTFTFPANGTTYNFTGYQSLTGITLVNATSGVAVNSSNYTITNYVYINGNPTAQLTASATTSPYNSKSVNISATYAEPTGYVTDSPTRGILLLVIFAGCLGIMLAVLKYVGFERLKELIGG